MHQRSLVVRSIVNVRLSPGKFETFVITLFIFLTTPTILTGQSIQVALFADREKRVISVPVNINKQEI